MKIIRYTLNANTPSTATDAHRDVRRGDLSELPAGARLLPPCSPSKIICVARNYAAHAKELGNQVPEEPLFFLKPPSSLIGSGDAIVLPPISERVDFEGELGVVIGKRGRNIKPDQARDYIFGYTCLNDITARDLQKKDGQWTRAKGFDTFCAVGPCVVPRDEVNFDQLRVQTIVDDEVKQDGSVRDMLIGVDAIIAHISAFMTLEPGDLIASGTPPGVGPLQPGSKIKIKIDGIGVLENTVVKGQS